MSKYGNAKDIFNLAGKNALIPGGSKGLGREMAICLMENGCNVTIASRTAVIDDELAQISEKNNVKIFAKSCDATSSAAVDKLVGDTVADMGRIDILLNCAGVNVRKWLWDLDDASWDSVMKANLDSTFYLCRAVSRHMRANNYGKIINMSSMKSVLGVSDDGYSPYCTSKGAVNMFTKQIACELASSGITVNAIAPTFIKTAINAAQLENEEFRKSLEDRIPVGRIGQFRDLMGCVLLLASDASQFITGQVFLLDGGISARQ